MESIGIWLGTLAALVQERLAKLDVDGSGPRRYGGAPAWCAVARTAAVAHAALGVGGRLERLSPLRAVRAGSTSGGKRAGLLIACAASFMELVLEPIKNLPFGSSIGP